MSKVGKALSKIPKAIDPLMWTKKGRGILFGKKGEPGGFIDPELEAQNLALAKGGYGLARDVQGIQGSQLRSLAQQYSDLQTTPYDPVTRANAEIAQRRQAIDLANRGQSNLINKSIAKRGLSGSAAGLFAEAQANQAMQDKLAELGGSKLSLIDEFERDRLNRQNAILSQQSNIIGQIDRPFVESQRGPTEGTKGISGILGGAVGGIVGGFVGGPKGAAAGSKAGYTIGSGAGDVYRGWQTKPRRPGQL